MCSGNILRQPVLNNHVSPSPLVFYFSELRHHILSSNVFHFIALTHGFISSCIFINKYLRFLTNILCFLFFPGAVNPKIFIQIKRSRTRLFTSERERRLTPILCASKCNPSHPQTTMNKSIQLKIQNFKNSNKPSKSIIQFFVWISGKIITDPISYVLLALV